MESWVVGYEGDDDVERHAGSESLNERTERLRIRAVSDYICPWCYVGLVRAERLMGEFEVDFDICAFDLKPGIPPEGLARERVYAGRVYPPGYIDNLIETARDAGIDMKRPPIIPNTRKAHEATEFARGADRLIPFHRAVFAAYFEREENIGDVEVLCRIGAECGLDAAGLREVLSDGRYRAEVEEQIAWTRAAGITGVPTFIFEEKFALVGAQEYEVFRDVAQRVAQGRLRAEG